MTRMTTRQHAGSRGRRRSGVTLMELIVALTITGLMAAAGTATFGSIIDSKRLLRDSTADAEHSAALRETLNSWMMSATFQIQQGGVPGGARGVAPRAGGNLTATTRTPNGAEAVTAAAASGDEATFTTQAPNPANAPNARMRLFVDSDDATPEHGLTLEYQASTQAPLRRQQLDSTVLAMRVEYLDSRTSRWFAASQAATIRPSAVRISLMPAEGATISALLQLPLIYLVNAQAQQGGR